MRPALARALPLVLVLLIAGCGVSLKERAVQTVQSVHAAASNAQDAELSIWAAELVPRDVYSESDRRAFHGALADLFAAEQRLTRALQAWTPGETAPASLTEALLAAQDAAAALQTLDPPGSLGTVLDYLTAALDGLLETQTILEAS